MSIYGSVAGANVIFGKNNTSVAFGGAAPAVASVIFSMDADGSSGYSVVHTETTDLPVSGDTYYLGTNNNGSGGSYSAASPSWSTVGASSSGDWTISGTSVSKSESTWNDDYILGKSALGSENQTVTDINFDTIVTASFIGFVRASDVDVAKTDEAILQFGFYLDNGSVESGEGATRVKIEGSSVAAPYPPNWTTSSKFKIEILVDV